MNPRRGWAAVICLWLSACSGLTPHPNYSRLPVAPVRELAETPFFPQDAYQCGPAALATLLNGQGVAVSPEQLAPRVYLPDRTGSLQVELLAAPARYARLGVRIEPSMAALLRLVSDDHPVLVLQNFGLSIRPVWHYAVVVGYDLARRRIVLRSGTRQRVDYSFAVFLKTWSRAGYWGMVVVQPDQVPAGVAPDDYLGAAAALERQRRFAAAGRAYRAATRRWPDNALAWSGRGNADYSLGDYATAEAAYRQALLLDERNPLIMNNLALALARRGCVALARSVLACAQRLAAGNAVLDATAAEIDHLVERPTRCAAFACPPAGH